MPGEFSSSPPADQRLSTKQPFGPLQDAAYQQLIWIAVIAITLGRKLLKTTILENNIIQTTGSAGESIAAGVVFTLPGFLFLSKGPDGVGVGEQYFDYLTIMILAAFGGMLGTLMMIPLRRSLIVKEHGTLPYPEGTACASVLEAGEKGGVYAATAFMGMGVAFVYALFQKLFHIIAETPGYVTEQANQVLAICSDARRHYAGVSWRWIYHRSENFRRVSSRICARMVGTESIAGDIG